VPIAPKQPSRRYHRTIRGIFPGVTFGTVWSGMVGLTQSTFHIHRATEQVICQRLAICEACPQATRPPGKVIRRSQSPVANAAPASPTLYATSRCLACTCFIHAKVTLADEQCPVGKW
jgi:hypothetical protein